jgi:hypothetical protein
VSEIVAYATKYIAIKEKENPNLVKTKNKKNYYLRNADKEEATF